MNKHKNNIETKSRQSRRDFLKKGKYAAYASPTLTLLVVENASAVAEQGCTSSGSQPNGCGAGVNVS